MFTADRKPDPSAARRTPAEPATQRAGAAGPVNPLWSELAMSPVTAAAPPIQLKGLEVSQPDDPLEREADAVADQVMRMAEPGPIGSAPPTIQRMCAGCEEEEQQPT